MKSLHRAAWAVAFCLSCAGMWTMNAVAGYPPAIRPLRLPPAPPLRDPADTTANDSISSSPSAESTVSRSPSDSGKARLEADHATEVKIEIDAAAEPSAALATESEETPHQAARPQSASSSGGSVGGFWQMVRWADLLIRTASAGTGTSDESQPYSSRRTVSLPPISSPPQPTVQAATPPRLPEVDSRWTTRGLPQPVYQEGFVPLEPLPEISAPGHELPRTEVRIEPLPRSRSSSEVRPTTAADSQEPRLFSAEATQSLEEALPMDQGWLRSPIWRPDYVDTWGLQPELNWRPIAPRADRSFSSVVEQTQFDLPVNPGSGPSRGTLQLRTLPTTMADIPRPLAADVERFAAEFELNGSDGGIRRVTYLEHDKPQCTCPADCAQARCAKCQAANCPACSRTSPCDCPEELGCVAGKCGCPAASACRGQNFRCGQSAAPLEAELQPNEAAKVILELMDQLGRSVLDGTEFQQNDADAPQWVRELANDGNASPREALIKYIRALEARHQAELAAARDAAQPVSHQAESLGPAGPVDPTMDQVVDTLREAAIQLDQSAHLLEEQNLYYRADQLRGLAHELRQEARSARGVQSRPTVRPIPTEMPLEPHRDLGAELEELRQGLRNTQQALSELINAVRR